MAWRLGSRARKAWASGARSSPRRTETCPRARSAFARPGALSCGAGRGGAGPPLPPPPPVLTGHASSLLPY